MSPLRANPVGCQGYNPGAVRDVELPPLLWQGHSPRGRRCAHIATYAGIQAVMPVRFRPPLTVVVGHLASVKERSTMKSAVTTDAVALESPTIADIADAFEMLAELERMLQREFDDIKGSRSLLSTDSAKRLISLSERILPAADLREQLMKLDPQVLQAGIALSMMRKFPNLSDACR
jgi:hypothetical protein